jgi:LruC domain-containing protein
MKNKILPIVVYFLLLIVFLSCNRNNDVPDEELPGLDSINIPDGFMFKTTKEIELRIKMPLSIDFTDYRGRFDIHSARSNKKETLLYSGSFDKNGFFEGTVKVPATLEELYVTTIAGTMELNITSNGLKEGGAYADFGNNYINTPPDSLFKSTKCFDKIDNTMLKNTSDLPNRITNGDFSDNNFGTIAWWSTPHPVDGRWYLTTSYAPTEYYNDGGNYVVRTPYVNGYYAGGVSQMIDAREGDVVTFYGDIKGTFALPNNSHFRVWLYLIPYDVSGNAIDYFAIENLYPTTDWETYQVVATMPTGTVTCQVLFWAHDLFQNQSIMFDNAYVTIEGEDTDGDGVADDEDDYPNDPERAFNVFYPNETDWGTIVFEDLWPGKGDYDFNDLVYDYHFKSVLNAQNELVEFFTDYSVRAVGASLKNGFGFMIGGNPENVASITGTNITENYIDLNSNGTEQNQTNTVIIVFDNAYNQFDAGNYFINTLRDSDYIDPDTNQLHVLYTTPVSTATTGTAPYNPFLIVNKNRGQEVHLAGQLPTDLVDVSFFGQWADDTDPATGKYYQTVSNLPWALDLPVSFEYPVEKVEISSTYNHFVEWAESGGAVYVGWYEDNPGYRNRENIYTMP